MMLKRLLGGTKHLEEKTPENHEKKAQEYDDAFDEIIKQQDAIIKHAVESRNDLLLIRERMERDPFPYLRGR